MRCSIACAPMEKGIWSFSIKINSRVAGTSKMETGINTWVTYWLLYSSMVLALGTDVRKHPLTLASPRKFNILLFISQQGRWCNQGLNTPNKITEKVSGRAGITVQEQCLSVMYLVSCLHFSGKVFLVTIFITGVNSNEVWQFCLYFCFHLESFRALLSIQEVLSKLFKRKLQSLGLLVVFFLFIALAAGRALWWWSRVGTETCW